MSKNIIHNKKRQNNNNTNSKEEEAKGDELNNNNDNINDETSRLNEDPQYQYFLSHFKGEKPKLRPELKDLKEEVLRFGSDINDADDPKKYEDRPVLEKLGHKLYNISVVVEHYTHIILSIAFAIFIIYYTNLFYNLYFNPRINNFYLYTCALLFILDILIFMYVYLYLPYVKKLDEDTVEKHFEEVVPYCTGIGVCAFICLIISMWNVYSWYSIPMVIFVFWGLIMSANFIQSGTLGNITFLIIILLMLFSYKFIDGPGKTYYK